MNAIRSAGNIAFIPAFLHDLYKSQAVSERIVIYRDFAFYAEFFKKIVLSRFNLPHKTFPRRHQAIGLKIPTSRNYPFSFFYKLFDSLKQFGGVLLDLLV